MLSASAGLGGSLILVPSIAMFFGTKQGIALASLLLACNNIFKVIAYHRTIPVERGSRCCAADHSRSRAWRKAAGECA